jgi:hypothetical protein
MERTKYNDLCNAYDHADKIKEDFRDKFVEIFSNYMNCPKEQIALCIDEPNLFSKPIEFPARLSVTLRNGRVLEAPCISLVYYLGRESNGPIYKIKYKDNDEFLNPQSPPSRTLDNIYTTLLASYDSID